MVNPKSLENLKQNQVKGAGPGRPKGSVSIVTALKKYLADNPDKVEEMVRVWVEQSLENHGYANLITDRVDGKLVQPVSGENGQPIQIVVRWDGNRNSGTPETATPPTG